MTPPIHDSEGNPKFDAARRLPDVRYSKFARSIGLFGIFVDDPEQLGDAWERALTADIRRFPIACARSG